MDDASQKPKSVSQAEIKSTILSVVANALDTEKDLVGFDMSLASDLGAESLDFLDITYQIERHFGIQMPRENLIDRVDEKFGPGEFFRDGVVTEKGLTVLRQAMLEVPETALAKGLRVGELLNLITPVTLVRVTSRMIAARENLPKTCPACGGQLNLSKHTPEATCAACDRSIPVPDGNSILLSDFSKIVARL